MDGHGGRFAEAPRARRRGRAAHPRARATAPGAGTDFPSTKPATAPGHWLCYAGRWPHIHFEVYPSLSAATSVGNKTATSQIALPKTACDDAYAIAGYESSVTNLSRVSLASDNVFSDGSALELATVTRSVSGAFTATLTVAI